MKIRNIHERTIAATPEQIAPLLADFERIWPKQIAPAPRAQGERLYETPMMLWQEYDRPGAGEPSVLCVLPSYKVITGSSSSPYRRARSSATPSKARLWEITRRFGGTAFNPRTTRSWRVFSTT
jgi:hypothetical protein